MRKSILFSLLVFSAGLLPAQIPSGYVQTTATVSALANGQYGASWTNLSSSPQLALLGCVSSFQQTVSGAINSFGSFSVLLADTAQICPTPSTWTFTISCPAPTKGSYQVAVPVTGGGGTEDISAQIAAALPSSPCSNSGGGGVLNGTPACPAYYQGTIGGSPTGTVGSGVGACFIPNLVVGGAAQDTALAQITGTGGYYSLPQGLINYANPLVFTASGTRLEGVTWGNRNYALNPTVLNYSGTSGYALEFNPVQPGMIYLNNLNIYSSTGSNTSGAGIYLTGQQINNANENGDVLENIYVDGFPQCMILNAIGNSVFRKLYCNGGSGGNSSMFAIDVGGSGANSLDFSSIQVNCNSLTWGYRLQDGGGDHVELGDINACLGDVWIGDYGHGYIPANADVTLNDHEATYGPAAVVDQYGSATVHDAESTVAYYLGPAFEALNAAQLVLDVKNPLNEQPLPITSATPSSTGGVLTSSSCISGVCTFAYESTQSAFTIPGTATTVALNSGVSATGACTFTTGTTNSCALVWSTIASANGYTVCEYGTVLSVTGYYQIATTSAGNYTVTGSESLGAPCPLGNVPLGVESSYQSNISCIGSQTNQPGGQTFGLSIMDVNGESHYCPSVNRATTLGTIPAAGLINRGSCSWGFEPSGTTGSDALNCYYRGYVGSTPTDKVLNLLNPQISIPQSFTDTITNPGTMWTWVEPSNTPTEAQVIITGTGTSNDRAQLQIFNASQSGCSGEFQISDTNNSTAAQNSGVNFSNCQITFSHPFDVEPFTVAISGTNQSSPLVGLTADIWDATGSASAKYSCFWQLTTTNTANTPAVSYALTCPTVTHITPASLNMDISVLPGGLKAASFNPIAGRKGTFTCTSGGTITIANANELATSDVIISLNAQGGTISTPPGMKTVTAGTGFTVLCATSDTSVYNYDILN